MAIRFASGLLRLWVVVTALWFVGAGVYIAVAYQNVPERVLKNGQIMFDDLIPAYEHCWNYRTSDGQLVDRRSFSDDLLQQVAECERTADRWQIVRTGALVALCIPLVVLAVGWGLVWAFRGFLPQA